MKIATWDDNKNWEKVYVLRIPMDELAKIKLDTFDNALIDSINKQSPISIADTLLGLELICRKIEQGKG